jgi:hypothetical protein
MLLVVLRHPQAVLRVILLQSLAATPFIWTAVVVAGALLEPMPSAAAVLVLLLGCG